MASRVLRSIGVVVLLSAIAVGGGRGTAHALTSDGGIHAFDVIIHYPACSSDGFHIFINEIADSGAQYINPGNSTVDLVKRPAIDGNYIVVSAQACWQNYPRVPTTLATLTAGGKIYQQSENGDQLCDQNGQQCSGSRSWDMVISSDGMAPRGIASYDATLEWNGQSVSAPFQVMQRPVILIHGLKSNSKSWQDWYKPGGFLCSHYPPDSKYNLPPDYYDPSESPSWDPNWCGFPIDLMDTASPSSYTLEQNAQKLADYIQLVEDITGAYRFDLVGHSMGGLIARWYISNVMYHNADSEIDGVPFRAQPITRLAMLGTPNMGSSAATEGSVIRKLSFGALAKYVPQPATDENSPRFVQNIINTQATDRLGVHFLAIGGDVGKGSAGNPCISLDGYPSDLVVNRASTKWTLGNDEYVDMNTTHIGKPLTCKAATDGAEQQSQNDFGRILPFFQDASKAAPPDQNVTLRQDIPQPHAGSPPPVETSPIMAARGVLLKSGKSVTVVARSATGAPDLSAMVGIDPALPHPQLALRAPNGTISTPQKPQPGVTFEDVSGAGGDVPPVVLLSVANPKAGLWRLTATNATSSKIAAMPAVPMFTTDASGGPLVQAQVDQPAYIPGRTITLTAQVTGAKATSVTAEIDSADSASFVPIQLTLKDDGQHGDGKAGDGVYGATFPAPATPGNYEALVTAANGSTQRFDLADFTISGLVVKSTADGSCPSDPGTQDPLTIRCAIQAVNGGASPAAIAFAIPSNDPGCNGGVCTIVPSSTLPVITAANTVIDGSSQAGTTVNTLAQGDNSHIAIRLDGNSAGSGVNGLALGASGVHVQGIEVTRFSGNGIAITDADDTVSGSYIGTDGSAALGNGGCGIGLQRAQNAEIGGPRPAARNLIGGNAGAGVCVTYAQSRIEGNEIGTNAAGTEAVPNHAGISLGGPNDTTVSGNLISGNGADGIVLASGQGTTVSANLIGVAAGAAASLPNGGDGLSLTGGSGGTAITANTIGGNTLNGIEVSGENGSQTTVAGNAIGADLSGAALLGNVQNGIYVHTVSTGVLIGGSSPGARNLITHNGGDGVLIGSSASDTYTVGNAVSRNSIWNNGTLGIDLAPTGTVDCATSPPGPNDYTQCPVISGATTTTISGTACAHCTVEVFIAQPGGSDTSHGQGKTFLGAAIAGSNGVWLLQNLSLAGATPITATATTAGNNPETSEFASDVAVS